MATSIIVEEESGTNRGRWHPHNGYYAGDFARATAIQGVVWGSVVSTSSTTGTASSSTGGQLDHRRQFDCRRQFDHRDGGSTSDGSAWTYLVFSGACPRVPPRRAGPCTRE
jgi:hypothetical protein